MKNEDYVSLEVAKLLKENGFDNECEYYISENTSQVFYKGRLKPFKEEGHTVFPCPSLYEAQKWLRYAHHIHVSVHVTYFAWDFTISNITVCRCLMFSTGHYGTYEDALNAGILEALKLI